MAAAPKRQHASLRATSEAIEQERRRLRRALSVMACARFALDYRDWIEADEGLDCADVVQVACELVSEVMANLDAVNLQGTVASPISRRSRRNSNAADNAESPRASIAADAARELRREHTG